MDPIKRYRSILENAERYQQVPVTHSFDPVMSQDTFDLHYKKLYAGYVQRAVEGDHSDFTVGGVKLHDAYFEQLQPPRSNNRPHGESLHLITEQFGSYGEFQQQFEEAAVATQGSAWVYLSRQGTIKTIKNHRPVSDIALILDMWEHAYIMDFGSDKKRYVDNFWKIIDWSVVNIRLG